jgi:hypothetical protein
MIIADLSELHHRFKAKRTGMSAVEYANPFEHYRRPSTAATKFGYLIAAAFLMVAVYLGAK